MWLLAASAGSTDWLNYLLQGGPFGILLLLFIFGFAIPKPSHDRVLLDNERLRGENEALRKSLEERVIPTALRLADVISNVLIRMGASGPPPPWTGAPPGGGA